MKEINLNRENESMNIDLEKIKTINPFAKK